MTNHATVIEETPRVEENQTNTQPPFPNVLAEREFDEEFAKSFPLTVRFLMSRGTSMDLAEELAQAAWARGWEHRHELRNPAALRAWINTIALRLASSAFRRDKRIEQLRPDSRVVQPKVISNLDAQKMLGRCKPRERLLLRRRFVDGCTHAEIAEELGASALAVRVRLVRVLRKLASETSHRATHRK